MASSLITNVQVQNVPFPLMAKYEKTVRIAARLVLIHASKVLSFARSDDTLLKRSTALHIADVASAGLLSSTLSRDRDLLNNLLRPPWPVPWP